GARVGQLPEDGAEPQRGGRPSGPGRAPVPGGGLLEVAFPLEHLAQAEGQVRIGPVRRTPKVLGGPGSDGHGFTPRFGSTEDGARKITRRVEPHGGRSPRNPPPLLSSLAEFLRTHPVPAATPPVHPNDTRRPSVAGVAGEPVLEPVVSRGEGAQRERP